MALYPKINLSLLTLLIAILFVTLNCNAQTPKYKYFVGNAEPDTLWNTAAFNDASWLNGYGSIGFGDNDDTIVISHAPSVYIRYQLKVFNNDFKYYEERYPGKYPNTIEFIKNRLKGLILYADYDDGFIAYLNGIEILRVNMDTNNPVPYKQLASRSHEANNYRGYHRALNSFFIDTITLNKIGVDTLNTIAFQVHNHEMDGDDLSFQFDFNLIDKDYWYNLYQDKFIHYQALDSSELPIIVINTDEYGIGDEPVIAQMCIINDTIGFNQLSSTCTNFEGRIQMRLRGQTSKDFPKASYKIETQDSFGENLNVSLLGMPAENDWIISGPFSDKSQIKNELVFTFGRKLGYYEPRTRYCEFVLNGIYMGLYILTEQIKRNSKRVKISKLESTENSGMDITGGYIIRYDKETPRGKSFQVYYPKEDDITIQQTNYIENRVKQYESVLASNDFLSPEKGYKTYINDSSLIDYIIINELTKNIDSYYYSTYLYKDRDDKDPRFHFGPLWDYDFAFGYSFWENIEPEGWMWNVRELLHLKRILQDTAFTTALANRWFNLRKGMLNKESIYFTMDSIIASVKPSIDRNYEVWPVMGFYFNYFVSDVMGLTYQNDILKMKTWIAQRLSWMDNNIEKVYFKLQIYDTVSITNYQLQHNQISFYPNPFNNELNVTLNWLNQGECQIELYDISGRLKFELLNNTIKPGVNEYHFIIDQSIQAGVYLLVFKNYQHIVSVQKVIKTTM